MMPTDCGKCQKEWFGCHHELYMLVTYRNLSDDYHDYNPALHEFHETLSQNPKYWRNYNEQTTLGGIIYAILC